MTTVPSLPPASPDDDVQATQIIFEMAESLGRTVCIALSLVENGRAIDLTGLDRGIGLLCAKALDLPVGAGRAIRHQLINLLAETDRLKAALEAEIKW